MLEYDYYTDGDDIIFRPGNDDSVSYYYYCGTHHSGGNEGGDIVLSTLGEHDGLGGAIVDPYVFTTGNGGSPAYNIAAEAYHIGVITSSALSMNLLHPDDVEIGMTYLISDVTGGAGVNNITINVLASGAGAAGTTAFTGTSGVKITSDWGYVKIINVQNGPTPETDRTWIIISSSGIALL